MVMMRGNVDDMSICRDKDESDEDSTDDIVKMKGR